MAVGKRTSLRTKLEKRVRGGTGAISKSDSRPVKQVLAKSSLRRQKRKLRDQLKPKLEELATALDVPDKPKLDHTPNAHKRGARAVEKGEIQRFGLVLKDKTFRSSPFDALKRAIAASQTDAASASK
ncbi:hypothetical protein OGAPHI_002789 [Ogataea philodendri]|uniref:Ribosome biogenesis protein SLX9 n=1 Tax=Ogataea philodendri TaxID=1378263 RepID=A0A9P8P8H0_9ASCO|nr:uncharacterized protein OGAPHI_002789 [Ogataea philodendri]KAH3667140.1 hypothetical protein OGAPHI_002789 [Ogataea philodendri]